LTDFADSLKGAKWGAYIVHKAGDVHFHYTQDVLNISEMLGDLDRLKDFILHNEDNDAD